MYKKQQDFSSIGELLEDALPMDAKFKGTIKTSTLFAFWGQVVGRKFESTSKPVALRHSKLHVACQNAYVSQELGMFKSDLLKKISTYATPLEIEIEDIIFSHKDWQHQTSIPSLDEDFFTNYTQEELDTIKLNNSELACVKETISGLSFLSEELKEKYCNDIINSIKAKELRARG